MIRREAEQAGMFSEIDGLADDFESIRSTARFNGLLDERYDLADIGRVWIK